MDLCTGRAIIDLDSCANVPAGLSRLDSTVWTLGEIGRNLVVLIRRTCRFGAPAPEPSHRRRPRRTLARLRELHFRRRGCLGGRFRNVLDRRVQHRREAAVEALVPRWLLLGRPSGARRRRHLPEGGLDLGAWYLRQRSAHLERPGGRQVERHEPLRARLFEHLSVVQVHVRCGDEKLDPRLGVPGDASQPQRLGNDGPRPGFERPAVDDLRGERQRQRLLLDDRRPQDLDPEPHHPADRFERG